MDREELRQKRRAVMRDRGWSPAQIDRVEQHGDGVVPLWVLVESDPRAAAARDAREGSCRVSSSRPLAGRPQIARRSGTRARGAGRPAARRTRLTCSSSLSDDAGPEEPAPQAPPPIREATT